VQALLAAGGAWLLISGSWIHAKAALAQVLLQRAWQNTLAGEAEVRPWDWADTWPVARLEIPRLGASLVVLEGSSGRTLAFGPGHTQGTSLPGETGTSILTGHRDTHFAVLERLRLRDEVTVERSDGGTARYRVENIEIADARTSQLGVVADENVLLLVTCWPFDAISPGGPLRYIATARLASDSEPDQLAGLDADASAAGLLHEQPLQYRWIDTRDPGSTTIIEQTREARL
jgi:sortase A